jgi:NAD(P)-dependent dehydrogenase (short-subunit alcohol dehydrogenase family)
MRTQRTNRRNFLKGSGAAVSTALVPATAHAASQVDDTAAGVSRFEDCAAIRKLYRDFVTQQSDHLRVLRDPAQEEDTIEFAADGQTAVARFHCLVENAKPLVGDAPFLEMARQQGLHAERWWESGIHELACVKIDGAWRIRTTVYRKLRVILSTVT